MSNLREESPRLLQWGGARNRADRPSHYITEQQARMLLEAAERSLDRRAPFNRFISISWEHAGIPAKASVKFTGEFIAALRDWLNGHGQQLDWAWVQESGLRNAHCHILAHIPHDFEALFRPMPLRWVKKLLGGVYVADTLESQRLPLCASPWALIEAQEAELMAKVHYMLKAAPAALEWPLGMVGRGHEAWGSPCVVYGKRCAVRPRAAGTHR